MIQPCTHTYTNTKTHTHIPKCQTKFRAGFPGPQMHLAQAGTPLSLVQLSLNPWSPALKRKCHAGCWSLRPTWLPKAWELSFVFEWVIESCSVVSDSLWPHGLHSPWNSPGQNTGVGSLSLPLGIFPIQGSNPRLPHCRWIRYHLSHKGRPLCSRAVATWRIGFWLHWPSHRLLSAQHLFFIFVLMIYPILHIYTLYIKIPSIRGKYIHNVHMYVLSHSVLSESLWPYGLQPARLLCPWGFSRQ